MLVPCHLCDVTKMTVIPVEAGIQKYLNKSLFNSWIPTFVGMTVEMDSRFRGNDRKPEPMQYASIQVSKNVMSLRGNLSFAV